MAPPPKRSNFLKFAPVANIWSDQIFMARGLFAATFCDIAKAKNHPDELEGEDNMARHITMQINGKKVVAELLDNKAPNVAAAFADSLPCKSFSTHAKFAGEELIVMMPFFCNPENEILNVKPGDIGFYPGRQTICIFYGDTQPFGKVSVFAKITKGLEHLKPAGQKILSKGPIPTTITLS